MTNVEYTNPNPAPGTISNETYVAPVSTATVITETQETEDFSKTLYPQRIVFPDGSYLVNAVGAGYAPDNTTVTLNGSNKLEIKLSHTNTWTGLQSGTIRASSLATGAVDAVTLKLASNAAEIDLAHANVWSGEQTGTIRASSLATGAVDAATLKLSSNAAEIDLTHANNWTEKQDFAKVQVASASNLWSGTGVPTIAGTVGDFYLRTNGAGAALSNVYLCTVTGGGGAATWVGIA